MLLLHLRCLVPNQAPNVLRLDPMERITDNLVKLVDCYEGVSENRVPNIAMAYHHVPYENYNIFPPVIKHGLLETGSLKR